MHCDHCVRRYERGSVAVEAVCVVSLNYGHCDTATRNCATEWSLRITATQLLKKRRHGYRALSVSILTFVGIGSWANPAK